MAASAGIVAEGKKKREKAEKLKQDALPAGFAYVEAFDFSAPLGAYNLYRTQGTVNWGPMTGIGTKIDDRVSGNRYDVGDEPRRALDGDKFMESSSGTSPWELLSESSACPWVAALGAFKRSKKG